MWQDGGRDPHVIINDVFFRETCGGIENLLQIRQLEISALNFNSRVDHVISAQSLCLKASGTQNTALFLNQRVVLGCRRLTMSLPPTYFQTSALLVRPIYVF